MLKRQFGCRFGEGQGVSECPLWRLDEYCRHWFIDWIWVFLPMGSRWHCSAAWHSHQGWQHPHFPIYLGPSTSDVPYSVLKNYLPSHSSMVVRIRHGRASLIQGSFLVEHSKLMVIYLGRTYFPSCQILLLLFSKFFLLCLRLGSKREIKTLLWFPSNMDIYVHGSI